MVFGRQLKGAEDTVVPSKELEIFQYPEHPEPFILNRKSYVSPRKSNYSPPNPAL